VITFDYQIAPLLLGMFPYQLCLQGMSRNEPIGFSGSGCPSTPVNHPVWGTCPP